ncbi:6-phosphogluconolactonase [Candidatus Bipolaricaulota bacterium]
MKIVVFRELDDLYCHAADRFARLAEESIQQRGRFLVLLSGGTTPIPLYQRLTKDPWRSQVDWRNIIVGWGDERCVPPNDEASNYRQAFEALLSHVPVHTDHILRIRGELDPEAGAVDYEQRLRHVMGEQSSLDLVLLGLGADGHTASLFPDGAALQETSRWFAAAEAPIPPVHRVTVTLPLTNASRSVMFLATGGDKAGAFARIRQGEALPAAAIHLVDSDPVWLVDEAIADAESLESNRQQTGLTQE